jgi:hypothetical protein
MLAPLTLIINLLGRVGMYFMPATIAVYPIVLMYLKSPAKKIIYITILLTFVVIKFYQFFYSDIWKDSFGVYQTIFSAGQWY